MTGLGMQLSSESRLSILWLSCLLCALAGCDVERIAVNSTAGVFKRSESVARSYFDWESAGQASPSGLIQLEGMHLISPDNEDLTLTLVKAYMAYAYGWVMDAYDVAKQAGDYDLAEHHRARAYLMYSRARDLALRAASKYDPDLRAHLNMDSKSLAAHLKAEFDDDAKPSLYWLMMSWTSAINNSPNAEEMSDMSAVLKIAEWIVARDPGYEDAGALVVLGGWDSSMPKAYGGNPERGKTYFERALKLTGRKNHIILINYATIYAINVQDRQLYVSLLHEILEAPDLGNPYRMSNKVARRRAARALARTDEIFVQ